MNKLRDSKGRFLAWLNIKKFCSKCGKELNKYSRSNGLCQKCYLSNIFGENNPAWKGGLLKKENYRRDYNKRYRHEHGISKKYIGERLSIEERKIRKKAENALYKERFRNGGKLTIKDIQQVYEDNIKKFKTLTCYLCYIAIQFGDDSIDHKTPLSRNGTNEKENLDIAHMSCNFRKHNRTEEEYRNLLEKEKNHVY